MTVTNSTQPPNPGRNDPCPCKSGYKFKKCCLTNKKPAKGVFRSAYNHGSSDPFMARMFFQIADIRKHIYSEKKYLDMFDKKHSGVFQNLYEARLAMEKCIELLNNHKDKMKYGEGCSYDKQSGLIRVDDSIDTEFNMLFKDFFIRGNIAIGCLVRLCNFMGYNIGFAFSDKDKFEKKKAKFLKRNPGKKFEDFCKVIEDDRKTWHGIFVEIRNQIEHEGFEVPQVEYVLDSDDNVKPMYFTIQYQNVNDVLEICWRNLFNMCEDIIVFFMNEKLSPPLTIVQIPGEKRNPNLPVKFKVGIAEHYKPGGK